MASTDLLVPERFVGRAQAGNQLNDGNALMELREHRARFARAWQNLGPSPQAAQAVADAYRPESARNAAPLSLRGKNSQEVAAPLQAASAKKDFMLANQMHVAYQRQQLCTTLETSPADRD